MTELPKGNKSYFNLQSSRCSMLYKSKSNYCLTCMIVFIFLMTSLYSCEDTVNDNKIIVSDAYELRISGKAEKAEELLIELLKKDSTNAFAWFELARTKHHLFLGGTQFSAAEWEEVVNSLQQATRRAPDNKIIAFYYAYSSFFDAYISMMMQNPDAGENIASAIDAFQSVLNLDPDCHEAQLYLVDIYGYLPEDMGGNKEKAGVSASDLNDKNKVWGAMANARLMPDNADFVLYWKNVEKEAGIDAQVLEELGRAYLLKSDTENGTKYFKDAISTDMTRRYLYMHLVRYHLLSSQQNPNAREEHIVEAEKLANSYLQSSPVLTPPLKAYAYGILALIKMFSGDYSGSSEYQEIATSIDPYYSKGMGIPSEMLYCPPDEVKIQYNSFFLPF